MEFIDLKHQQNLIYKDLRKRIDVVLEHGKYINGPEVKELEKRLANFVGMKYAVGVSNGTDALIVAMMALGVEAGDKVITSPFTFFASAEAIKFLGAEPVFVDIDPKTYNISVDCLKKILESNPGEFKGIIPVDIFGQSAEYDEIEILAKQHNLFVLEDAAQSFGGIYKNRNNCSFGDIATTSFFPAKPLGCYGDGGMVFTNSTEFDQIIRSIRVHGKGVDKYDNIRIGVNARLDTLQAAILLAKFQVFEHEIELRQEVAKRYTKLLKDLLITPYVEDYNISVWAQYSVQSDKREQIIKNLKDYNIPAAIYYPKPLHLLTAFKDLGYQEGDFPIAEAVSKKIFSLPMHPYLELEDQKKIAEIIKSLK
jgi:UDP-2-acetamido-2-deoxy-ribo-hexuluronate aminotransferase